MTDFIAWLQNELDQRGWAQIELTRRGGISSGAISKIMSGERKPGPEICNAIAVAFKIPPEDVFRAAGLLPPKKEDAPGLAEWMHLYTSATPEQREEMLDYARFKARQNRKRPAENS